MRELPPLTRESLPADPIQLFRAWLDAAVQQSGLDNPNAVVVSTVGDGGVPEGRIVLLKQVHDDGVVFFTNRQSRKGLDLASHPHAAINCFWDVMGRQVRIVGPVDPLPDEESDAYFATRPRGSQIGAWASHQSQPLSSREALEARVAEIESKYKGEHVPRPPHWGGYKVRPIRVEFWQSGESRLHDRFEYARDADGAWTILRLNP